MDINRTISRLPQDSLKTLKDLRANVDRVLARDPEHVDAKRLGLAIKAELTDRKLDNRKKEGSLWWEPHDPDVREFFAFATPDSAIPVVIIFKSDTHTAMRKDVYSVRIGDRELAERFANVAAARQAGSKAWDNGIRS